MVKPKAMSEADVRTQAMIVRSRASRVRIHAKWFDAVAETSNLSSGLFMAPSPFASQQKLRDLFDEHVEGNERQCDHEEREDRHCDNDAEACDADRNKPHFVD